MNPFKALAERYPSELDRKTLILEAIAAQVSHGEWDYFYAAKRGAYKVAGIPLRGSWLDGAVFIEFLGLSDQEDPDRSGPEGMWAIQEAAHEFLQELYTWEEIAINAPIRAMVEAMGWTP